MFHLTKYIVIVTCLLIAAGGCSQSKVSSTNSASQLSGQEMLAFGDSMLYQLESNGVLKRNRKEYGRKPVIMWTKFRNMTDDPQMSRAYEFMYNSLEAAMVNSGKATVNLALGGRDKRNEYAQDFSSIDDNEDVNQTYQAGGQISQPTLIMRVEVVSAKTRSGRNTQYDYMAKITLIDGKTRDAAWIGTVPLTKYR